MAPVIRDSGSLSSANLLGNSIGVEQAQVLLEIKEAKPGLTTLCGLSGNETELDLSGKGLGPGCVILLALEMEANGSLSSLIFKGNHLANREAGAALGSMLKTSCTSLTALDVSENSYHQCDGPGFASEIASGLRDAKGSLSKLTFSGDLPQSKPVTVEVGMTEADFSGAKLQQSGAMILAAWLKHKVQHDSE